MSAKREWQRVIADQASTRRQRIAATRKRDATVAALQDLEASERNLRRILRIVESPPPKSRN